MVDAQQAIGEAAQALNELREAWLNPPDASEAELKKRTPNWLTNAHARLDRAVWAAYGWDARPHSGRRRDDLDAAAGAESGAVGAVFWWWYKLTNPARACRFDLGITVGGTV